MQVGKNNNRFRKLIPHNNRHINPTTAQIYSSHSKPYSGSQSKINTIYSNSHKSNYHSLQRQSAEDLKLVRQRQLVERRLRTISAATLEGDKHNDEHKDNKLKRNSDRLIGDQIKDDKKSKLSQLMDLIIQFKFKTDSIFKYEQGLAQTQNQAKEQNQIDETIFEEEVYQLITKTQESSIKLMSIYINRVLKQIQKDVFHSLVGYKEQIAEVGSQEQMKYESDRYLVADILVNKEEVKDRRNRKERGNLMNINKFLQRA